jgi:hypothetical protein
MDDVRAIRDEIRSRVQALLRQDHLMDVA